MTATARGLSLLVLLLAVGCSSATRRPAATTGKAPAPTEATEQTESVLAVAEDASGFTITQQVSVADDIRDDYDVAVRLLADESYQPGIALLTQVIARAPDAAEAHIALGIAYSRTGELDLAEASLLRALELSPRHPVAHNELGLVQRQKGQFVESRASYEAALAEFADFHYAHRNLAILCDLYLGDYPCALEHYEAYSRIVPDDDEVSRWITDLRNRGIELETP